jgi:exodeoxyribonuclease X
MSAIHHLTDDMVKDAAPIELVLRDLFDNADYACSHMSRFDRMFLPVPDVDWLDTYRASVSLAPKAPSWKLQALRYWLKLDVDIGRAMPPHRAGPDSYVTAVLLARILGKMTVEQMFEVSSRPMLLPRFGFGKHKGVPLEEVPADYLRFIIDCKDPPFDEDVLATARHHLKDRQTKRRA